MDIRITDDDVPRITPHQLITDGSVEVEIANKPEDFRSRLNMSPLFEGQHREKTMVVGISHLKAIHDHIASEVFRSSIVFNTTA